MASSKTAPYISIVATARNDNHGGDMLKRLRVFVKGLIAQCNKFQLPCELVMVEWNPIPNQPLLTEVLPSVSEQDYLSIRYVVVPPNIHQAFAFSKEIPLFQMIAKNVGIRRARANFVLCTNVDLLFSDEMFELLAKRNLKENCFYRANRCDVPNTLDETWSLEKQLNFCRGNIKNRLGKNWQYPNFADTRGILFKLGFMIPLLSRASKLKARFKKSDEDKLAALDLEACGDFTMMSKKDWLRIQGYPELEVYSIHIDSMGILAAAALDMEQVIFPPLACTYHMEHTGGWEFSSPIEKIFFYTKKPMLDWWTVRGAGLFLFKNKTTFNLNKESWGLLDQELEEYE